ncbi:MAG TPA: macrolide ABC transporter ATP-binding protein [Firmicutes bacterium]|nr:macrolide ABC transporter ATP-binding protein [Bacillota bacterium]
MNNSLIRLNNVGKEYLVGEVPIKAVDGISFNVEPGELIVVLGPSGAGKSTVLNIIGGMDRPTSGEIWVEDQNIANFSDRELTLYRRKKIGFVFQFYNLMPNLTALENVELAAQISDDPLNIQEIMEAVELEHRLHNFPAQLSGGEQQRVAIARAVAKNPLLLLCDEPTGALDYQTGKSILILLSKVNRELRKSVMIITHNSALAMMANRVIRIKNGRVERIEVNESPESVERIEW